MSLCYNKNNERGFERKKAMKKIICLVLVICTMGFCSCGLVPDEVGFPETTEIPMYELVVDGAVQTDRSSLFGESAWEPGKVEIKEIGSKNNSLIIVNNTIDFCCAEDNCKLENIIRAVEVEDNMKPTSREEAVALFANGGGEPLNEFRLRYTLGPKESAATTVVFYLPVEAANEITWEETKDCCFSAVLYVSNLEAEQDSFGNAYDPG